MRKRVVFDTNACHIIASSPNGDEIIRELKAKYDILGSVNTVFELVLGVCRSPDGRFFSNDQRKLQIAIGGDTADKAKFLDYPLTFALTHGTNLVVSETGSAHKLFRQYSTIILRAATTEEVKTLVPFPEENAGVFPTLQGY